MLVVEVAVELSTCYGEGGHGKWHKEAWQSNHVTQKIQEGKDVEGVDDDDGRDGVDDVGDETREYKYASVLLRVASGVNDEGGGRGGKVENAIEEEGVTDYTRRFNLSSGVFPFARPQKCVEFVVI